jgi:hypothetical protein
MADRIETEILVPISLGQAERVFQQVVGNRGPGASLVRLLLALGGHDRLGMTDLLNDPEFRDRSLSQTLIISLLILSAFHGDVEHRITDLARELGISQATTVRYLKSWVAVGVLEQNPSTRKYRIARRWQDENYDKPPLPQLTT